MSIHISGLGHSQTVANYELGCLSLLQTVSKDSINQTTTTFFTEQSEVIQRARFANFRIVLSPPHTHTSLYLRLSLSLSLLTHPYLFMYFYLWMFEKKFCKSCAARVCSIHKWSISLHTLCIHISIAIKQTLCGLQTATTEENNQVWTNFLTFL